MWQNKDIPDQFKDAVIVTIYKHKGDSCDCDNHGGISLLAIASKILTKILQYRLVHVILNDVISESQCDFRSEQGTMGMIFAARQLQEKCVEQNNGLFVVFIELTKAFDSVPCDSLWKNLGKKGVLDKFTRILMKLHDSMHVLMVSSPTLSQ